VYSRAFVSVYGPCSGHGGKTDLPVPVPHPPTRDGRVMMAESQDAATQEIDTSRPHSARVYDYFIGGCFR